MMDEVKKLIENEGPLDYRELNEKFPDDEFLKEEIDDLLHEGEVIEWNGQIYPLSRLHLKKATVVSVKPAFIFAAIDGEEDDIRIDAHHAGGALLGDRILVGFERGENSVYSIFNHKHKTVVGEVIQEKGVSQLLVKSIAPAGVNFVFDQYDGQSGELAVAEIISYGETENKIHFIRSLGDKNAPGNDITRIVIEEGAPNEFTPEVDAAIQDLPYEVGDKERAGRHDFREEMIVTIDGEDARDFDDAVTVSRQGSGYRVSVHIADVSYYVRPKNPIDAEAYRRGTSIYLTDRVIPMLPFPLSNGICSLNEGVERLTESVIMDIDEHGNCLHREIVPGLIRSHGRLTYTYVQTVLDDGKAKDERERMLLLLDEVAKKIRKVRTRRGSLDLDTDEMEIEVDEAGRAIGIHKRVGNEAEALIEDLMILANEQVAEAITEKHLPMLYRIHELPDAKRIDNLNYLLKRLGHKSELNPHKVTPLDVQRLLKRFDNLPETAIITEATLRSLAKARYDDTNKGHFGLASTCYTHFTSPIRRYPDLIVHRLVRKYLFENKRSVTAEDKDYLHTAGADLSVKERRAVTIERRVDSMKAAEFMSTQLGQKFSGYIEGISNIGFYMTLDNGLSGLVRFDSLSDYYVVDEARITALGKRHHHRFMLGDHLDVVVAAANKENGTVDLVVDDKKISLAPNQTRWNVPTSKKNSHKSTGKNKYFHSRSYQGKKKH